MDILQNLLGKIDVFCEGLLPQGISESKWLECFGLFMFSAFALQLLISFFFWLRRFVLSRVAHVGSNLRSNGKWAIVTGASDGIGKEYVMQLAEQGMNVVLVARNMEKLKKVADEAEEKHRIQTQIVIFDFKNGDKVEMYEQISLKCSELEVGVLVNNVGVMPDQFLRYHEVPNGYKEASNVININIMSAVLMTSTVLPKMVERNKGIIINIASFAGVRPLFPFIHVYPATKIFHRYFSNGVSQEYLKDGITVQCVNPMGVKTQLIVPFNGVDGVSTSAVNILTVSARSLVEYSLCQIGLDKETIGHPWHSIQAGMSSLIPTSFLAKLFTISLTWIGRKSN